MRIRILCIIILLMLSRLAHAQEFSSPEVQKRYNEIKKIHNDTARVNALNKYALKIDNENPRDAILMGKLSQSDAEEHNFSKGNAKAFRVIGHAYKVLADYPKALQYMLQALKVQKEINDYSGQITTNIDISTVYDMAGDLDKQQKYVEDAMSIANTHIVARQRSYVANELATVYKKQGKIDTAIKLYRAAIENGKMDNDSLAQLSYLCNMAIALKSKKDFDASLIAYNNALALTDTVNDKYEYAVILDNMAILFYEMKNYKRSELYALRALSLQKYANEMNIYLDAYDLLRKIYTHQEKYPLALDYFEKWVTIKDSVLNTEKSQQIKELQTRYDTDAKDKQINTQKSLITYNRKLNFFLAITSILVIAIGAIIFVNQRRTSKLNKLVTKQKQELEQLNSVKDRIFSVIGHDMRTPVNSLISFTQLLEQGDLSQEKLTIYTASLKKNLQYTGGLLENLLNWARTQMQGYNPVIEKVDISLMAEQAVGLLADEASKKGILLHNGISSGIYAMGDTNMIALIIRNLLSNAIKYTPADGVVKLSATVAENSIQIRVQDSGVGISAQVVERFNAGTNTGIDSTLGTAREKGTGLGLLLCKSFATLMGGNIKLESEQGKGSCFIVSLPAA